MPDNISKKVTLDQIVSLCKQRGFVYQSAEIYGGINGVYDFGPLGHLMKQNIKKVWSKSLKNTLKKIVFVDGALLGPESVWKASGHLDGFHDPMVDCTNCKHRFRADHIDLEKSCANCGKKSWTGVRDFNLMFKTSLGANLDNASSAYLRPETAQTIFVNFKNIMNSSRSKIPFGIAQVGKSFRNEITPKQFLFRTREFEQMELEWFCKKEEALKELDFWLDSRKNFYKSLNINMEKIRFRDHDEDELAHYSSKCLDVEYNFPFGWKELEGIAYRGDYDLSSHNKHSGKDLNVFDDNTKESYTPHVIECSVGVDRLFITLLFDAYSEDTIEGETRTVLKLNHKIAPIKAAILPLTKKLSPDAYKIYENLVVNTDYEIQFDETGSIGKRYRRQDEIGTPICITFDFDSLENNTITVRDRDTLEQKRIKSSELISYLDQIFSK